MVGRRSIFGRTGHFWPCRSFPSRSSPSKEMRRTHREAASGSPPRTGLDRLLKGAHARRELFAQARDHLRAAFRTEEFTRRRARFVVEPRRHEELNVKGRDTGRITAVVER